MLHKDLKYNEIYTSGNIQNLQDTRDSNSVLNNEESRICICKCLLVIQNRKYK